MIRLGIAGTGAMAKERLACFAKKANVRISAIYSRAIVKSRQLAGEEGAESFENYRDMLDSVDGVVICLPNNLHFQFSIDALCAGKHVLVEYPLAMNTDQAEQLQQAAMDHDCVLMVGNTIIHEAPFHYVDENKERLGNLVSAASRVAFYGGEITGSWFLKQNQLGSVFTGLHYHHLEYYKRLFGEPVWVMAQNESISNTMARQFAGGTVLMGHRGNKTSCVQWYLSNAGSGLPRGMWLNGTNGSLTLITLQNGQTEAVWNEGGDNRLVIEDDWGVDGSCEDFIKAMNGQIDHKKRLKDDMQTLRISMGAQESSKNRRIYDFAWD